MYDDGSPFVRVSNVNREKLKELEKSFNVRSYDAALSFLLKNQDQEYTEASRENLMDNSVPVMLTGLPGRGKNTFLRNLIPSLEGLVFVLDVHDEYPGLRVESHSHEVQRNCLITNLVFKGLRQPD